MLTCLRVYMAAASGLLACRSCAPQYDTGYTARAKKLGYRMVAAVSGTTANVLQYGAMLGFTPSQMVLLRLTMAAWMLPTVRSLAPPFPPLNPC